MQKEKFALLSVYHKEGIVDFALALQELGWKLLASGGTAHTLTEAGVVVTDVAELVGGEPILAHRVVTLAREIHAGLMARDIDIDLQELERLNVPFIDLVCVDLYPLHTAIASPTATLESVTEQTDIGGPTLLRSAAKGRRMVICDPADRPIVLEWLREREINATVQNGEEEFRLSLAAKAECIVAHYTLTSARFLSDATYDGVIGERGQALCYGENKRQTGAALYGTVGSGNDPLALHYFHLIEGGAPSYINITDLDRLVNTATHIGAGFEKNFGSVPYMAIAVKHGNVCGVAVGDNTKEVMEKMIEGDPSAISGGYVLVNFALDGELAMIARTHELPEGASKRILDGLVAPEVTPEAVEELSRKTGKCRIFENPALAGEGLGLGSLDVDRRYRQVRGGFLAQEADTFVLAVPELWRESLTEQQLRDLVLGWAIGSTANSNTIVLTGDDMLKGRGIGQHSRVLAAKVALLSATEAGHATNGLVAYSDSFFPFIDGPRALAEAGIAVLFATSGSIHDTEVQEYCAESGMLLLTLPDAEARGFFGH